MIELIFKISVALSNTLFLLVLTSSIITALWFITLPLCGLCLYCWHLKKDSLNRMHSQSFAVQRILKLLYFVPFLITLIIAALGGNFQRNLSVSKDYSHITNPIEILLFTQLPLSCIVIWKAKKRRAFAISLSLLQFWISWCTAFVGAMTTSGQFL